MNLPSVVILPFSLCTFLIVFEGCMSRIALIFSRLALIPLSDTMKPKNFPALTPNVHFSGLSFNLTRSRMSNAIIISLA